MGEAEELYDRSGKGQVGMKRTGGPKGSNVSGRTLGGDWEKGGAISNKKPIEHNCG